jgi:rabenosyn-5
MSTGRILGRGRVLGSKPPSTPPQKLPTSANLPPSSDSSASLTSSLSTSTVQDAAIAAAAADLASNVSLPLPNNAATAQASDRLICPICNEQMVTLLQLNRHIDDEHQNLDEPQQDEVKNWFQRRVDEAKKIPALAVLNQKFKALDVFESNTPQAPASTKPSSGHATPEPAPPKPRDPEEDVTRTHWQRPTYGDICADPPCGKRLSSANGSVNCRKCGRLFCDEHTLYQMKLSRSAKHDPTRGVWCRVCETCYKSREGYNDTRGEFCGTMSISPS